MTQLSTLREHYKALGVGLTESPTEAPKKRDTRKRGPVEIHSPSIERVYDRTGQKSGILTVESYSHFDGRFHQWNVVCECGTRKLKSSAMLSKWKGRSCGRLTKQIQREARTTHGQSSGHGRSGTLSYRSWSSMHDRCQQSSRKDWMQYGGRGISVCVQWATFEAFFADMGEAPEGMSLDRFPDQDGNYEPGNCRWATAKEQANNRRNNRSVTYGGETMNVGQWADKLGIYPDTMQKRLSSGMSQERMFTPGSFRATSSSRPARVADYVLTALPGGTP
jgi:hypothetical protein